MRHLNLAVAIICLAGLASPAYAGRLVVVHVNDDALPGGDGSGKRPFDNLQDAVNAASSLPDRIMVKVQPGDYVLTAPLVIERSLELRGSTELFHDADGLPDGNAVPGTETRIIASGSPGPASLILAERNDGGVIRDIGIRGFIFQAPATAFEVNLIRAQNFDVRGNIFRGPALGGLQALASSGRAEGNHFSGTGSGAIFGGGSVPTPARVEFVGNRSVGNRQNGLLLVGVPFGIPDPGDLLIAVVRNNDLSGNVATPGFTAGVRMFIIRRDLGVAGEHQSSAEIHADLRGNRIAGNRFGIVIDAGFPYRQVGLACDPRSYSGLIDLTLKGNTLAGSIEASALVTFTRNSATLSPATLNRWQYLHAATFQITDPDGTLGEAIVDHPDHDPFIGPCPDDSVQEALNNTLIYNRAVVADGARLPAEKAGN